MFWDRRKKERRAKADKELADQERRQAAEKTDRRRWTCGILYKTSIPVSEIEQWLDANADDRWAVGLDSIDEGLASKVLKIMFENADDKVAFIEAFHQRQS